MILEIQGVSKRYNKNKYGLRDFSLKIEKGILGLLGPNGAGKSTLLKMIATLSKPTTGIISLNKNNIVKDADFMRRRIGFLPQDFGVYPNLNAYEFLEYLAAMKGIGGKGVRSRITQLLEGVNLMEVAHRPIGSYSGGMKQRIGIAQALLNKPKVLIFDEPTVGLDPEERLRFRNLITDLANECIVILSSHIVSDIDSIANKVAVMKEGGLLYYGSQAEIIEQVGGKVFEEMIAPEDLPAFKVDHLLVSTTRREGQILVRFITEKPTRQCIEKAPSLEDAYLFLTQKLFKNI